MTVVMMHMDSIGVGGLMLPPTVTKWASATTTPAAATSRTKRIPLAGWECLAANWGWFTPHVTLMTITMGMRQIIANATHVVNERTEKIEMNPSETMITRIVPVIPRAGCFIVSSFQYRRTLKNSCQHGS